MLSKKKLSEIKQTLDYYYTMFNDKSFIEGDPISIPHKFNKKEDIEIAAFFAATIAWGNRTAIINGATNLMERMDNAPADFIYNATEKNISALFGFYYRTFQEDDVVAFAYALNHIYKNKGGLENVFQEGYDNAPAEDDKIKYAISNLRNSFLETEMPKRSEKHIANPIKGSAAKRINMFLRWMVRKDDKGVDFGIWDNINPKDLIIPLDVHAGNTARKLGLLKRNANDWKSAYEVTSILRKFDKSDPIKYDFALFGISNSKFLF